MGIFVGDTEPSKIFVGGSEVASVWAGDTKVRPSTDTRTFTVSWTEASNPNTWVNTYSDDAAGLTQGSGDFDDFFAYDAVVLNDSGEIVGEPMKQIGGVFSDTMANFINGKSGNVMIRFPRMGIKMSKSGSTVTLSITKKPNKEGYQYYAFNSNGTPNDYLYLGAYKASLSSNKLVSVSGTSSIRYMSLNSATAAANQYSNKRYHVETYYARDFINALYKMKYANPNSQSVIGMGYVRGNAVQTTGTTNSITNATGATNTSNTGRIKLFGLEDRWGNVWEWLDGAYYSTNLQLSSTQAFKTSTTGGTDSRITSFDKNVTVVSGWRSSIAGTNDGLFAPNLSSGSSSTYYCDYFIITSGNSLLAGGARGSDAEAGAFGVSNGNPGGSYASMGSRLMYL